MSKALPIVRWLPLVMIAAACGTDVTAPAPEGVDSSLLVTSQAGKKGTTSSFVMDPQRSRQYASWDAGYVKDYNQPTTTATHRICMLNPLEDLDGNDFWSQHADGFREELVKEQDAIVVILEGSSMLEAITDATDVWVGRAAWNGTFWIQYNVLGSANSLAQGVIAPILVDRVPVSADAAQLLAGLSFGYTYPGSAGERYDPERILLTPDAAPTALITRILAATPADAFRGVECDWQQSYGWVKNNTITYSKNWPEHLSRLF